MIFLTSQYENSLLYTHRQVKEEKVSRDLYRKMIYPSINDLKNTVKYNMIDDLRDKINSGIPYLGTSAGTNICGLTIGTTNDMPIIQVESFKALELIHFNINPHYLEPINGLEHMGESRETRINEFHKLNDQFVVGLREGSTLHVLGDDIFLKGSKLAVIFKKGGEKFEIESGFNLKNLI